MGVYLPYTSYDYTKMQGPAPSGFHVPLSSEWQAVRDIRVALGGGSSDGTNFGIALKMPFAGYRLRSNAGVGNQGTYGLYWSSSRYNENNAYILNFYSFALSPQNNFNRAYGHSVRCFKDIPTTPTSSWTKLYGTSIESGGIFWSSADGLISLSSDGQTWITIQDKNLGATTVWNSGDTLSEANCGKYYQWGNNYGFPRTGSVTTSSTQVDASNYGPGNYYSSSTFITRSRSPYRWDTTDNGNLWGGVTGVNHMSELKNAYIGYARTPSSSTLAYRPLKSDIKDYSGNGHDLTVASGSVSYSNNMATVTRLTGSAILSGYSGDFTILGYTISTSGTECGFFPTADSSLYAIYTFGIISQRGTFGYCKDGGTWYLARTNPGEITDGKVHLLTGVRSSTTLTLYLDGVQVAQNSNANSVSKTGPNLILGQNAVGSGTCTYGNLIVENRAWTQQEIIDYYNKTKAEYGL